MPVWVRVDRDDPCFAEYAELLAALPFGWQAHVGDPLGGCTPIVREFFALYPSLQWYGLLGDDVVPRTLAWDVKLVEAALPDGLAYADDGFQGEKLATHPVIAGELVRAIGFLAPPELDHSFVDTVLHEIARETGRLRFLPHVVLEHLHPAAGKAPEDATYRYRETFERDRRAFERFMATRFRRVVARVRGYEETA